MEIKSKKFINKLLSESFPSKGLKFDDDMEKFTRQEIQSDIDNDSIQGLIDRLQDDLERFSGLVPRNVPTNPQLNRKMNIVKSKLQIFCREFSKLLELVDED